MTDQHSADALSCAGNTDVRTPNIDRLAERGVRYDNAYCAMPLSGPSRAAMFTGLMPSQAGMLDNGRALPDSLRNRTLGSLMTLAGYDGAYGGKWHVNTNSLPADTAFGFRRIHPQGDDGLADAVVAYLRQRNDRKKSANSAAQQPFFLVASFDNPHNICQYARGQQLPEADIDVPADVRHCPGLPANHQIGPYDPDILRWERQQSYRLYPTKAWTSDDWRRYRAAYYALIEHVDGQIGAIIDEIDRQGLWDNTVVIFTADHGDGQGAHMWNQKTALWQETACVPLIVAAPGAGKTAGTTDHRLVNNGIDLMPTLLTIAGAPIPAYCKGTNYLGKSEAPFVVSETQFGETAGTRGWMVRTPQYKYVLYEAGKNREALYDLAADPGEQRNLAVESAYDEVLARHRDILGRWFDDNPAGLPYSRRRFLP